MLFLVSVSPTCSSIVSCQCNKAKPTSTTSQMSKLGQSNQTSVQSMENSVPVIALGALLAFSVMLLAVVTTGWVCTCIYMKNKLAMNQSYR